MAEASAQSWRPLVAALANDDSRAVFARLVLQIEGDPFAGLSPSRRAHVLRQLRSAGIVDGPDDAPILRPEIFAQTLRQDAVPRPTGIHRFLRDGRITQYPVRPAERRELLEWAVAQALKPGERVTEREITERLAGHCDDAVVLRRYVVDAGLVERTATGSEYWRPE